MNEHSFRFRGQEPSIAPSAFIAAGARLVGDVRVGEGASIWFNAVLRGDISPVIIGDGSNVQDNAVLHVDHEKGCIVGSNVLIGHTAICHACTIGDGALIGMGAIVLSGAVIGEEALIAAGALIKENTVVPPRTLWAGNPAVMVRELGPGVLARMRAGTDLYATLAKEFREG
jgi:carbonic anhydrase/acetyltransferase-like protein (isoleucine patch superfamily)